MSRKEGVKVEKNPVNSEDKENSENGRESLKVWLQENLRMIVSVVIVVVIAGGIYSYSKRTEAPTVKQEVAVSEEEAEGKISVIGGENQKPEEGQVAGETEQKGESNVVSQSPSDQEAATATAEISKETGAAFQETAVKGDGSTKLARRALANYLEKNPDSALTAEHKVYIEDYLRRQVKDGRLKIGDTREFSKDMIANAIEKSKGLSENQLKNLQKYSQQVPDLK